MRRGAAKIGGNFKLNHYRLVRIVVAAFCLLSLLAALGGCWLWWEYAHERGYVADASVGGTYLVAESRLGTHIDGLLVRGWPGRAGFRLWSEREYYVGHPIYWAAVNTQSWQWFHLAGETGYVRVQVRTDTGEPVRWDPGNMPPRSIVRPSAPMPMWAIGRIPHMAIIAAPLVPPLLWAGGRWRRVREHRRRVRLGLCLACGYDLRHSPEKCPECGAVAVDRQSNREGASAASA